jgi:hypothetical protein
MSVQAVGSDGYFVLSEHGCGRATAYSEFNKIVTLGEKTHVSWLDSQDDKFLVRIRTLNRDTGRWSPTYTVGEAFDNHGGPSLTFDGMGYLHIVYYPHHHPFRYRRSLRPNDASQWTQETQFGEKCTYSSMICLPDSTLVLVCRESSKQRWKLNLYDKPPGENWQGPRTILHGQASSGYTRWKSSLALGPDDETIHMSFMLYEQALKQIGYAVGYLRSDDQGQSWQRSDGTPVGLPATPETIDVVAGARTPEGPADYRPGNVAVDSDGVPWLIYCRMDRQPFETWIAQPAPVKAGGRGQWHSISLLPFIQQQWPGRAVKIPGDIAFTEDRMMYVAVTTVDSGAEVKPAQWGHPSAEIALLVSRDYGRTFAVSGVSDSDPSVPNWLPNLERPTTPLWMYVPSLIFTHGPKGQSNKEIMSNEVIWCHPAGL